MKADNPFTLTFGKQPSEYISRYEDTNTILSTFLAEHPVSQTYLIEGIRGSGKTVLMTAIAREIGQNEEWIVVDLNSTQNLMEELAIRLHDACRRIPDFLKAGFNISVAGFGIGINADTSLQNYSSMIEDLLSVIVKKKRKVLITIDEVQSDQSMRHFASEFQLFIRKEYPVFLLMTGLYENIYAIQNDPALTFLLRAPKVILQPLSIAQITKQYAAIFRIDRRDANYLAVTTKGYAFAFQALGMLYYEYHDMFSMDEILSRLDDMLDDFVYRKIWGSLSGQDKRVVLALSDNRVKVKDICESLAMSSAVFSRYRDRLLRKGVIVSPERGYISLALPRFHEVVSLYEE